MRYRRTSGVQSLQLTNQHLPTTQQQCSNSVMMFTLKCMRTSQQATPRSRSESSKYLLTRLVLLTIVAQATTALPAIPYSSNGEEQQQLMGDVQAKMAATAPITTTATQNFQQHQRQQLSKQMNPFMQVYKISPASNSNNVTCNDGSQIGYYKRLNSHSKSWIIYLQGGGFCGSSESCHQRWQHSPHLMSSHFWPKTKSVEGILSSDPKENPYLWNANHIFVPYCSSDSWSGLSPAHRSRPTSAANDYHISATNKGSFAFMGSKIIERVLESLYEDLPRDSSLYEANSILLAGDSAGATGVIMNLDKVSAFIDTKAASNSMRNSNSGYSMQQSTASGSNIFFQPSDMEPKQPPVVRGLADSGWFLDNEPYNFAHTPADMTGPDEAHRGASTGNDGTVVDCDRLRCTPLQSIRQAMLFWDGQVPSACALQHPSEPWRCYFGYRAHQTLRTPLFVVQWLYDEAQLMVDNIGRLDTSGQWNYVHKLVNEMRASLENVTALFAPSCFSHSLIIRRAWNQININGFKLPHVLNSWEEQSLFDSTTSAIASNGEHPLGGQQHHHNNQNQHQPHDFSKGLRSLVIQDSNGAQLLLSENRSTQSNSITNNRINNGSAPNTSTPSIVHQTTFESFLAEQENPFHVLSHVAAQPTPTISSAPLLIRDQETSNLSATVGHQSQSAIRPNQSQTRSSRVRSRKRKRNNQQQQQRLKQVRQKAFGSAIESHSVSNLEAPTPVHVFPRESNEVFTTSNSYSPPPSPSTSTSSSSLAPTSSQTQTNPLQDLLPLVDRLLVSPEILYSHANRESAPMISSNGRLGRSTIVDDSTLMMSNSVPDDNQANQQTAHTNEQRGLIDARWMLVTPNDARVHVSTRSETGGNSESSQSLSVIRNPDSNRFRLIDSCGWPQCNRDCPVSDSDFNLGGIPIQF